MRICLIAFHYAEYAFSLAQALARRNNDVLLILNRENFRDEIIHYESAIKSQNPKIMTVPRLRSGHPFSLVNAFKTVMAVFRFKPHVLHIQETIRDYEFLSLLFLIKFPIVLTIHDHIPHTGAKVNALRRNCYEKITRKLPTAVIVHSEKIAREIDALLPWMAGSIFPIRHGVLGDCHKPFASDWEAGNLLFFGRIEKYKGIDNFIEVINKLNFEKIQVKGVIAGKGKELDNYRFAIGGQPWFELHDYYIPAERIAKLFRRANSLILPYIDATQSGVATFALCFGRPIVGTRVGGLPEVILEGHNGLIVPPNDISAMTLAIQRLVQDQKLAKKMAWNAYEMGKTEFSWEAVAQKTSLAYSFAINSPKA